MHYHDQQYMHMRACESVFFCGSVYICRGVSLCVGSRSIVCTFQASPLVERLSLSPGEGAKVLVMEDNSVALSAVRSHQVYLE